MARLGALRLGFALALLVLSTLEYAASEGQCRSGCQGASQTFKYTVGTTYKYNLEGNIDVSLSTAEGQQSSTKLKATVLLTQQPDCNQVLRLQNVQVIGPDAKKYSNIADIEKPIRINFHDGHIEDSICALPDDTQNSLNIKRAVASLFQAAIKHHHETDVFGVCPTEINTRKEGANVIIQKSRNLNKCAHRENIKQDFMATAFNLNSEIKSSPILNSQYSAEQRIKNGILDHAVVTEHYLYVPFSVGQNGAKASVSTKIQLAGISKDAAPNVAGVPKSIIFENPHLVNADKSNADSILSAVKETKNTIDTTVGENSAKAFVNLIKILRASKKDDLLAVYREVRTGAGFKDKLGAKKVFLDALLRAGTGDTIEVGIELLKNKELGPIEQKLVYLGLAFVKHATVFSLHAATGLLDLPNLPREAYLGVGTLAGRYCREHSCENVDALNHLIQKLVSKLGDGKADSRQKENQIISVLKALANVESLNDAAIAKIIAIAQDKKAPNRIRAAALETYLADSCKDKLRDSALNILKDIQQDSEIRIKAYLVAAQCPNGKVANALKALLDNEPSYQVGGFIVSHLRNLRATANPDKELAKQQLSQVRTNKKFPINLRKYSFNDEESFLIDTLGLAGAAEANVIYSQNSFLPRSTNLNLTAQVFGHTFNFLEIGTRQENLDKVLEHYLGPLGVLRESSADELVNSGRNSINKLVDHIRQRLEKTRGKRDVSKADIDGIGKQVQIKSSDLNTDLDLDLSVKLFGSELLFLSINDENKKLSPEVLIDNIFDQLDAGMAKAKNFEKSIQSNLLFIDSEFSYPTSLGFPLRLSVEGSASVQLKAAGKIDIRALLNNPSQAAPLKISLIPSANIEIAGSMTVDAQVVESGLKVTSTLYTATGGDLEVVLLKDNKGIDVKFGLPVEHQKLISATHEIVFNIRELGKTEVNQPIKFGQNKDFSVCIDQLSPFIGLAFCADINNPPAHGSHGVILPFPLSGNAKLSVGIQREDLSQYHFRQVIHNEPNKLGAEIILETLGAKNDKKVSLHIEAFAAPETFIKASIISPVKSLTLEGRITNTNQEKSISAQLEHDNQKYLAKIGVSVSGNPSKMTYKPLIEYNGPGPQGQKLPLSVEGAVIVEQKGNGIKYIFDNVKVINANNQRALSVQGNLGHEGSTFFSDVTFSDGAQSGSLKGKIQLQKDLFKVNAELKNSVNPQANVNIKYEYKRQPSHIDSNLQLIHGPDLSSKMNKLVLVNSLSYKKKGSNDFELKTNNKFSYPLLNVEAKLEYEMSNKNLDYDLELQYGDAKVGSELDAKVSQKVNGDYDIEFEIYGFDQKLEAKAKREITGDKSKIDNSLEINGKKLEVSGTITHHCKNEDINVGADLAIKLPGRGEPFKVQNGLILNANELDTHLKIFSGGNVYVDIFVKGTKGGNANGSLKISLKDFLLANGQLRVANGAGNAHIVVELVRSNLKGKVDTTFTIAAPTYNVEVTLYPQFEKDNSNKYIISTNNQVHHNSIDSKNFFEIGGKKLEANFKSSLDGKLDNGKLMAEAELTLPTKTNHYIAAKLNREIHVVNGIANGNAVLILEQRDNKNAPGRKATVKGQLKNANLKDQLYDLTYNIVLENGHGQNVNADLSSKRQLQGDHYVVNINAKLHGSPLAHPVEFNADAKYKDYVGSYKIDAKSGPKAVLAINGKYAIEEEKKVSGEVNVDLITPSATVNKVKFSAAGLVETPQEGHVKLSETISLFVDDNGGNPDATIDFKVSTEATLGPENGQLKATTNFQKEDPISVDVGYGITDKSNIKKLNGHLNIQYTKDKAIKTELIVVRPNEHEYKADFKLDSPQAPNTRLEISTKKSSDGKVVNSEVILSANKDKFVLTNELILSDITPGFDVKLVLPSGKVDRITAKLNKISPKQFGGELKLAFSENNFALDSTLDANIDSVDDFTIKVTANSAALKLDNVVFEAQNKPSKAGKRIQVSAKSAGKNLLSGSTSYKAREEGGKYIVEGSGSFKVKEESKQANFKFVRQALTAAKNGEDGVEISFNAGLGSKAVDAELKVTNKQLRLLNSYCEEKQQCAHVEVDSKTNTANAGEFNHELELAVDLRKLGLSHEFGLKGVTTRKNFVLDHTVDIYFQSKENKYQYSLYVHPSEAGAQLTTPKRVIAIEGVAQIPKQGKGPIKGELALYLNKKGQPNQKTALTGLFNCHGGRKGSDCTTELKLTNPALGKDLSISYTGKYDAEKLTTQEDLVIDVFPSADQKIVISGKSHVSRIGESGFAALAIYEAKSPGLKINAKYEGQVYVDPVKREFKYSDVIDTNIADVKQYTGLVAQVDPHKASLVIKAVNRELVNANCKHQISKDNIVADTEVQIVGVEPVVSHLEIKNLNTLKYTVSRKATPNDKLQIQASFILGKIADFRAEVIKGGAAAPLVHSSVKLDEANFLKSDAGYNAENIKNHILAHLKNDVANFLKELKTIAVEASNDLKVQTQKLVELLKKNVPNFKPLRDYYQKELQKLREELISDKTIKEVGEFLKGVFGAVIHSINEVLTRVSEISEKVASTIQKQFARVIEIINKEIIPKITDIAQGVVKTGALILEQVVDLVFTYLAKVSLFIEAHQEQLKQIATAFSAVGQEVGRFVYRLFQQARVVVTKEWNELYHEIQTLPIAEELKTKYEELFKGVEVPEAIVNTFKEAIVTLKDVIPNQDVKKLITVVGEYIEKKLKRENVDDVAAIQNIISLTIEVINKLLSSVSGQELNLSDSSVSLGQLDFFNSLPRLAAVKFSPLSYLLYNDFPTESLYGLSLNPRDLIPPYKLDAVIVQGQHIFTFDGKHLTFPGNCNYLLARDAVNGNFSIVGTFTNGLLTAITVADKTDTVTLKKGGQVLLNNAATEFPVRKPKLNAWRRYESLNIHSKAGVRVVCGSELLVCGIHINGFYHAQLRGLLGNGNSEPYDDYTLPNGKIVSSESDFGNSYKIGGSCAAVKTVDHSVHHHNPACNKLFGADSPLRICYNFVNPENYKTACDHGLAAGVKDTEKAIAVGYVASCRSKHIPVSIPAEFAQCTNSDQPRAIGDTFSVKTPAKAADIVVIVDQVKSNEVVYKELVQPAITQIASELSSKGINDIEFHLIGYGGEFQLYPSHYTVAGKLTFKGRSPNLKFADAIKEAPITVGCPQTDRFIEVLKTIFHDVKLISGQTLQQRTYADALDYPFRAHAVKSVIAVVGAPCEEGHLLGLQKLRALLYANKQISLNLITPFDEFSVKDTKETKNIIGFNSYNVFTFTNAKKKPEGTSELHSELDYDDYCVDFTLKNRGNVFVTNNFLQAKGATRKQFAQVTAHNIVEQLLNVEQGLDCECQLTSAYSGENVCTVSYSKERTTGGKKGGHKG